MQKQDISSLGGIAQKLTKQLKKLGITTIEDLLWYAPSGYDDRRTILKINALHAMQGEMVTVQCKLEHISERRSFKRGQIITEARLSDTTGEFRAVWFGNKFVSKILRVGDTMYFTGRVYAGKHGVQLNAPEYERVSNDTIHSAAIVPRYALTAGITNRQMRYLIAHAVPTVSDAIEWLPQEIIVRNHLLSLSDALSRIHFPSDFAELQNAQRRLAFDELLRVHLRALHTRLELSRVHAPSIHPSLNALKNFVDGLPFHLTQDQKKCGWAIIQDMVKDTPMNRLLQGDVGSGKTVIASIAMYNATLSGYMSVLMAPTEILAQQHFETLRTFFLSTSVRIALYTHHIAFYGKGDAAHSESSKKGLAEKIINGEIDIVIGTHALLYEPVRFPRLCLAIVDEQHRFGVAQRRRLKERIVGDHTPHFLSMTATPIPRSVALAIYGELDISIVKEKPAGRKKIFTKIVPKHMRDAAYAFVRTQLDQGRQAFVVCPLIDISDVLDVASVEEITALLREGPFKNYRIEILHGKMASDAKEAIMQRMVAGKIDILVSTSVIEVGVDVPNATVMMIEGGERFGLAQLHQFRGRVGRSDHQSYCVVFSNAQSEKTKERLKIFASIHDGFLLSQKDFEMRGYGDMYGLAQSGFPDLKFASMKDGALIAAAKKEATWLWSEDLTREKFKKLWEIFNEWEEGKVHLE